MPRSTRDPFDYAGTLRACAEQRPEAMRALYEHEAPRLLGIALRVVRRREVAEDVVHEVFVQLWHRAALFDPARGSARAWLGTITRNRAINTLRRQVRDVELDEASLDDLPDSADNPAQALARIEDGAALRHCLGELDETKRTCILLAYIDGYSQSQIADRLKVPLNTAKTWIRRGLLSLRECLQ